MFSLALATFCVLGTVSFCIMAFFPHQLADLMRDSHAAYSILALAPAVFCVCLLACMRGYTQGQGNMTPTAVSQVLEALCKVGIGLPLAWYLLERTGGDMANVAAGAIFGVTAGTILSVLLSWSFTC